MKDINQYFNEFRRDVADAAYTPAWSGGKTTDEVIGRIKMLETHHAEMTSLDGPFFKILAEHGQFRHLMVELLLLAKSWTLVWGDHLSPESLQQFRELEEKILAVAGPAQEEGSL